MPLIIRLDRVMADRKITSIDLANRIGIAPINLSRIKTGKVKALRFSTLDAICRELKCQPGELLEYQDVEDCNESMVGVYINDTNA